MVLSMLALRIVATGSSTLQAMDVWTNPHFTILGMTFRLLNSVCRQNHHTAGVLAGTTMSQKG
jgi:hypothetical protein